MYTSYNVLMCFGEFRLSCIVLLLKVLFMMLCNLSTYYYISNYSLRIHFRVENPRSSLCKHYGLPSRIFESSTRQLRKTTVTVFNLTRPCITLELPQLEGTVRLKKDSHNRGSRKLECTWSLDGRLVDRHGGSFKVSYFIYFFNKNCQEGSMFVQWILRFLNIQYQSCTACLLNL